MYLTKTYKNNHFLNYYLQLDTAIQVHNEIGNKAIQLYLFILINNY